MKKYSILLILLALLLNGCTINYSVNFDDESSIDSGENSSGNGDSTDSSQSGNDSSNQDEPSDDSSTDDEIEEPIVLPSSPDIQAPITIDTNAYFYPNTLSKTSDIINEYSYIDETETANYKIYSAYYSEYYDTLYIAYDTVGTSTQTLKAKDLYHIERHALNYFNTDNNKTDYKEYLKAVLIYPDTYGSACRKGKSDNDSIGINGCANHVGKEAVISLNRLASLTNFYEERKISIGNSQYYLIEPMRFTFAHEFGHVSTFYNMAYKNDEDYEDYLKLRLENYFTDIYPNGTLPTSYSSSNSQYYTHPLEILADDYVELFYNTTPKAEEDTYVYSYPDYTRNSLKDYSSIQYLVKNPKLKDKILSYYVSNFLDYSNKVTYGKPILIHSSRNPNTAQYYESYSKIEGTGSLKYINSTEDIYLIAVGHVIYDGTKYYRVILSNTVSLYHASTDIGKKIGYVKASAYSESNKYKIYRIDKTKGTEELPKHSLVPINDNDSTYILPYYDFSYVVDMSLVGAITGAKMYDYLNDNLTDNSYTVSIASFGTLVS